jgi:hypothetical protein
MGISRYTDCVLQMRLACMSRDRNPTVDSLEVLWAAANQSRGAELCHVSELARTRFATSCGRHPNGAIGSRLRCAYAGAERSSCS